MDGRLRLEELARCLQVPVHTMETTDAVGTGYLRSSRSLSAAHFIHARRSSGEVASACARSYRLLPSATNTTAASASAASSLYQWACPRPTCCKTSPTLRNSRPSGLTRSRSRAPSQRRSFFLRCVHVPPRSLCDVRHFVVLLSVHARDSAAGAAHRASAQGEGQGRAGVSREEEARSRGTWQAGGQCASRGAGARPARKHRARVCPLHPVACASSKARA